MPTISITVPGLLRHTIGERDRVEIDASTLDELIGKLKQQCPLLVPLVWDEQGQIRRHVLIFLNDTATKYLPRTDFPLHEGDRLAIVQAVSGG
jgi:molybdopterin converting factor small subunit